MYKDSAMITRSFNYYGYDRETYKECSSLIRSTNRKHITILNTWFVIINILYLVFSYLNLFGLNQERIPLYAAYLSVSIIFEIWILFFPIAVENHIYFSVISSIVIFLSYGVLNSMASPYMPATLFLVLLVLTSLSYIGNMTVMIFLSLFGTVAFLTPSYLFKTFSIAYHDTYNAVIIITLAIGLHYTFQRTRVAQFILYQRDLQIQKELEIKSSFDALTLLLNRGKFLSICEEILRIRSQDEYLTLCLVDLDGFKEINDNLGHQMGDKVIQITGKTLMNNFGIKSEDRDNISKWDLTNMPSLIGRLGGDEFIILVRNKPLRSQVIEELQRLLDSLNSVKLDGVDGIHASLGATELKAGMDIDEAYRLADEALYESKRAGKNQIHFNERV